MNPARRPKPSRRAIVASAAGLVLLVVMALSTKVVRIDSAAGVVTPGTFSAAAYGAAAFPKVKAAIERRAVAASTLAAAISKDQTAAAKRFGVATNAGAEFSVTFSGIVGKGDFGTYDVGVAGLPKNVVVRVQTGPAIVGTDLRDATGTITFGQFTNQIEYQNAGSALNKELKKNVLAKIDTDHLTGKTISVVGAFPSTEGDSWLVTPVKLDAR